MESRGIADAFIEKWDASLPVLHEVVLTGTLEQKRLALRLLADMRDTRSAETLLLTAAGDSDILVQTRAIIVLRDIGDRSVTPTLRDLLRTSRSEFVLSALLAALGKLGSSHDIPLVRPWLASSEEGVRVQAAAALALLGNTQGQEILLVSTRSKDPLMQQWATEALGYLNTADARTRLKDILDDPEAHWKSYARIALARQELSMKGAREKTDFLRRLTRDRNDRVARWAVEQLAELGTAEATQLLRDVASKGGRIGERAQRRLKATQGR
jgi:HEAT repeat protein